eukprot:5976562-Prymnesium_polylepis.1
MRRPDGIGGGVRPRAGEAGGVRVWWAGRAAATRGAHLVQLHPREHLVLERLRDAHLADDGEKLEAELVRIDGGAEDVEQQLEERRARVEELLDLQRRRHTTGSGARIVSFGEEAGACACGGGGGGVGWCSGAAGGRRGAGRRGGGCCCGRGQAGCGAGTRRGRVGLAAATRTCSRVASIAASVSVEMDCVCAPCCSKARTPCCTVSP